MRKFYISLSCKTNGILAASLFHQRAFIFPFSGKPRLLVFFSNLFSDRNLVSFQKLINSKPVLMKKIFTLIAFVIFYSGATNAQYSEYFEGNEASLTSNCWDFSEIYHTSASADVITGSGSLYTNPPTSGAATRDIYTPVLDVFTNPLNVSFNYKVSSKINGNATRTIEVGYVNSTGVFTSLDLINMDKDSPVTPISYDSSFNLASTGMIRLVLRLGGSTGDGNSRLIFDDLTINANPHYGPGVTCNSAPVAVNDDYSSMQGDVVVGNLMNNDNEPNGESMFPSIVTPSPDGTVVINPDGSFSFTPNPGFTGTTASFTYRLTDNGFPAANSNVATVVINISTPIILPVKLQSFEAEYTNPDVELSWHSAEETNFSHYEIERSIDGNDYSKQAVVLGSAAALTEKTYSYIDKDTKHLNGTIYYRLTAVDINGKMSNSTVRTVQIGEIADFSISTYPNPVVHTAKIKLPGAWASKAVNIDVFNQSGQKVKSLRQVAQGQFIEMNMAELADGIYIIKAGSGNETAIQKILKN